MLAYGSEVQSLYGLSLHMASQARGERDPFITTQRKQRKTLAGSGLREQIPQAVLFGHKFRPNQPQMGGLE